MYDFSEGRDIHEEWRRARREELERRAAEEAAWREARHRESHTASSSFANRVHRRDPSLVLDYPGQFLPLPR